MNTYLGQKGYTILKSELSEEKQYNLRKELTAKPFVQGSLGQGVTFSVYRESANKFYVPRYYGESNYGVAKENKLSEGDDIDLEFNGKLRELQINATNSYIDAVTENSVQGGGGLLELPCGAGKTICAVNILSRLKKKTLIIVHKEFLLNQWIERIEQFLPKAKIGKIQGQIIDIDGKDIVLGMLQSLSMKDYPAALFESFGLTIIDEVHHISSEVFSCALFKIVTKYMLGLSATMNRKDGTTYIFKLFLGDVVFKGMREEEFNVTVRAVNYVNDDADFNEVVYDFRGNVQYSTMISKLCSYNRRSEFILKVLTDMLIENGSQQIMILAHNKNLLKYLYDAIESREIATVGYYIGGMKERALKISETKKVVIATYSMAAEALDIKTLTTLIMATPKTDIEQSIGRILREKHGNPIVVDIVDKHEVFKNQWRKRKVFYKKNNYKIISTSNLDYSPNINNWKTVLQEKEKTNGKCLITLQKKRE
jgi:superfamily II DNA or RNA helicase